MDNSHFGHNIPLRPAANARKSDLAFDGGGGCRTSTIMYPPQEQRPPLRPRSFNQDYIRPIPDSFNQFPNRSDQTSVTYAMNAPVSASRPREHESEAGNAKTWSPYENFGMNIISSNIPHPGPTNTRSNMVFEPNVFQGPVPHGRPESEPFFPRHAGSRVSKDFGITV